MARQKNDENTNMGKVIEIGSSSKKIRDIPIVSRSIKKYREQIGMEQKELARRLGIHKSAVSNWETGFSKPNIEILVPICNVLGISLYELFGLDDPMMKYTKQEQRVFAKYKELNEPHRAAVSTMIDMLGDAELKNVTTDYVPELTVLRYFNRQLAAGIGDPTDMDDNGEPIYLYSTELIDKADYVFTVNGESMEPVYNSGDMVLVEKCTEIEYGQVGAFLIGNEAYIKECREDGLHSYNEKYKTMKFNDDDSVSVIGKVIGVITAEDIASQKDIRAYQLANDEA